MTNWIEHLRDGISALIAAAVAAVVAAIGWLVRTVFTNQRKIELLEAEISRRGAQRDEDRAAIKSDLDEVKHSIKRIEDVLLEGRG